MFIILIRSFYAPGLALELELELELNSKPTVMRKASGSPWVGFWLWEFSADLFCLFVCLFIGAFLYYSRSGVELCPADRRITGRALSRTNNIWSVQKTSIHCDCGTVGRIRFEGRV